ncbi:MAG: DUF2723 domain-containing protein [Phycisphaerales bacterium]|nr:MAG: DUF2723 domain-containing protein [Phycisphaerales bacterium]
MSKTSQPPSPVAGPASRAGPPSPWPGWLGIFVVVLALYAATANRGAQWQDSGSHILRVVTSESVHPLGLALSHPLHHWLGRLVVSFGLLEPCFAITLLSALAAAVAVANVYGCVLVLTSRRPAALLAAGSLAIAHTFWQMATLAETYTLVAALLAAECWCLSAYARRPRRGYLWMALLFNGLGIANHMLASLTTPILIVVVFQAVRSREVRGREALVAIGAWLVGLFPYTALVVAESVRTGDFSATLHSALFGVSFADEVLNTTLSLHMLLIGAGFVALNVPNLLLPLAICGIFRGRRLDVPRLARLFLLAGLILHVLFVARFRVVDQHMFFLPMYVLLSIFGGIGIADVLRWPGPRKRRVVLGVATALLALTPLWYTLVPGVAHRFDVLRSVARNKPYRDDYVYVFTPWSVVERSAEIMSRHAVELAGENGLILVEDAMACFAVRYQALRSGMEDLQITQDAAPEAVALAAAAGRAVVLVPVNADAPQTDPPIGLWKRMGDLYKLTTEPPGP